MLTDHQLEEVAALRRRLHACPERPGQETRTRAVLTAFLRENTSLEVRDMGGWLLATHFEGEALPHMGFRADMDALPLQAPAGAADHRCGHDGHSAILCGLAMMLEGLRTGRNVHLIFQASEETGTGARQVIDSWPRLDRLQALYALHNIPGFPKGAVLVRRGCFACASCGHIVEMTGRPAHAAYPSDGANPIEALCALTLEVPRMIETVLAGNGRLLMRTPIALEAGSEDFGISAHAGRLLQTLRGHRQADIQRLMELIELRARALGEREGLACRFEVRDVFPDTTGDDDLYEDALRRFRAAGLPVLQLDEPMRWSEDFGWLLKAVPGLYFGIGAGEDCPGLHTEGYAFDDGLIAPALKAFEALL